MAIRSILTGVGGYLPKRIVPNDELARRLETSDEWIVQRTGIRERRWWEEGQPLAEAAARAWAVGNVKAMKANYAESRLMNCAIGTVTRAAAIEARNVAETVSAIDGALKKPGKTIAVVNLGPLLRKGGVLEKLVAMGVTVQAPAEG